MQINMTGFLNGKNARQFMDELWALLLSAQESETGIPDEFIQQKKDEILRRDEENKVFDREKSDSEAVRPTGGGGSRFRPRGSRDNSRESSIHKQSGPSPSPGPRKQSADSTSVPDKNDENTLKGKRSPSIERSKDNAGKISSSRQRSRDRSTDKSRSHRHSNSKNHSHSDSSTKKRESEERKNDAKLAISNIQSKLSNIAESRKRKQRSQSRSRSRSRSRSHSRSQSRSRSRSRSHSNSPNRKAKTKSKSKSASRSSSRSNSHSRSRSRSHSRSHSRAR